jgi:hypothetical protein
VVTDPELAENFSKDFTDLPLSPVETRSGKMFEGAGTPVCHGDDAAAAESNPFGGFSFVASRSLLEDDFMLDA